MSTENNVTEAFKPFSWLATPRPAPGDRLAATALDIANGIRTILQLIERSDLDIEGGDTAFLDKAHTSQLMRMAMTSAELLASAAEEHIDWVNTRHLDRAKT